MEIELAASKEVCCTSYLWVGTRNREAPCINGVNVLLMEYRRL